MKTVREDYVQRMRDNYLLILRTLLHDLIVSIDKDGKFIFVNDAAVKFWGKSRKKLLGTHFAEYLHPDDVEKTVAALQDVIKKKNQVKSFIIRIKSPTGFRRVAWNGVAVFDDEGNYVGAQATGKDLTDILRAEEELEQSRSHLRRLFEVVVDPLVIVDMTGKILDLSQSAEEILGLKGEELVGKHFLETSVATAESKAIMEANLEKIKTGMYIQPHAIEAVTKGGKKLLYELTPTRITYNGEPAILAIFRNITEQKNAEQKLRASEERFKYFLDNAPEAIWVQDIAGTFIDGNKRAEQLTGYKRQELIGKNMLELLVPSESVPGVMEAFKANMLGEISGPVELEMVKKDGSLVSVEASTIPVERDGKIEIIGITRDITERKKAEETLRDSEKRFRELSELLPETVFEMDLTGRLTFVNNVGFERFGYSQKDFDNGLTAFQMLIEKDRDRAKKDITRSLSGTDTGFIEYTALRKDGSTFPIMIHSTPIIRGNRLVGLRGLLVDITDRKKMENKILGQNEFMNTVLNTINYPFYVIDTKDYTIKLANAAAGFGCLTENSTCYALTHKRSKPCTRPEHACTLEEVKRTKKPVTLEHIHYDAKGNPRTFEVHGYPIFDKDGNVIQMIENSIDITERKKAEELLKKSEERFRSTLESMLEGCQIIDYDWHYLYVNDAAAKHGRLAKKDFLGKTMMEVYLGIDQTDLFSVLSKCMKERVSKRMENEFNYPDGENAWFDLSIEPVPEGIFILSVDITDRKEVEEALHQEREMLETVTANINAGLMVVSKDYVIVWANSVLKKYLGEIEGHRCYSAINYAEDICHGCGVKEIFETGKDWVLHEQMVPTPAGQEVWLEITATAIRDETGEIVAASEMSWDITERKKTELALKEINSLLKQSNTELESYTYVVSHDLKAPLRTIKSFGSFIVEDYKDKLDETGQDYLNRMVNAASRMDSMIEDLLILSRVGRKFTEIEKVDLNKLLEEIQTDLEASINERNTKVVVDKLPSIHAPRVWMKQLFMNLISNALKFNESKTPKIEVLYEERENDHMFKVRDNGIGIEEKYLDRIFNLFERAPTEKPYDGTGAGLSICKKIVEHFGGKIWVESTPSKGSAFIFTISKEKKK